MAQHGKGHGVSLCPVSMICLPVHDIYHTRVDYRARKKLVHNFIPCTVVLTGITTQKFTNNIELPFSRKVDYGITFIFYP